MTGPIHRSRRSVAIAAFVWAPTLVAACATLPLKQKCPAQPTVARAPNVPAVSDLQAWGGDGADAFETPPEDKSPLAQKPRQRLGPNPRHWTSIHYNKVHVLNDSEENEEPAHLEVSWTHGLAFVDNPRHSKRNLCQSIK